MKLQDFNKAQAMKAHYVPKLSDGRLVVVYVQIFGGFVRIGEEDEDSMAVRII